MTKFLALCLRLGLVLVLAAAAATVTGAEVKAADKEMTPLIIEQSTESPIADMALIGRPPTLPLTAHKLKIEPLAETN